MSWYSNARADVAIGNWPFINRRIGGCVQLLDCMVGYDKYVVIEPQETVVVYYLEVTVTGMSTSKWPSMLSQTRTDPL